MPDPIVPEPILEEGDFDALLESIGELPLDELPEGYEDADNTQIVLPPGVEGIERPAEAGDAEASLAPLTATSVPFRRNLRVKRPRMKGGDVAAVTRRLHQINIRKGFRVRSYYKPVAAQVKEYQHKKGLQADGIYGPVTHKHLSAGFDAKSRQLYKQGWSQALSTRQKMVKAAMHGYYVRDYMHYTQAAWTYWSSPYGRMYGVRHKVGFTGIPRYEDCSSFATWVYWVSGKADPNGFGYNGYGFTGTLQAHGTKILWSNVKPGDLVFYGYPTSHVAIYVGSGRVVSFGSEIGPLLLPTHYRSDVNSMRSYF